jgi:hypothetical protein
MGRTAALVPTSHTPETIRGYTIRPAYPATYVTIIMTRVGFGKIKQCGIAKTWIPENDRPFSWCRFFKMGG